MQHDIKKSSHGHRTEAMSKAIQNCVHCGFCLAACPTYQLLGEEMDSPRGRIYLMKNVLEGNLDAIEAQPYIDRCLGCQACVPACPSGVQYGDLLIGYRSLDETSQNRTFIDNVSRTLIAETLPYPDRFRLAVKSGKLTAGLKNTLPEKLGAMLGLLPESLPPSDPLPEIFPAKGKRRARVTLLSGCVQQVLAPEINWATLRVLAENGVETIIPPNQGCCGSILLHIGEDQHAMKLARNNLNIFPQDVDAIITNAAGCGSGMHDYGLLFEGQSDHGRAETFAQKVQDITVFLDALGIIEPDGFQDRISAVYQDACHLLHAQGVKNPPRILLEKIPNLTLVELNDGGMCCGSAGTYNIEQPELAHRLGQLKVDRILETGSQAVISGNIGCLTQIQTHLAQQNKQLKTYHTIQVIDLAYQGKTL